MDETEYIGYLKYNGQLVEQGLLDGRKIAQALLGFDEAIRFFVGQQEPLLREIDFEIPVRIRKGTWEALISNELIPWLFKAIAVVGTTFGASYAYTAGKKMAENDFEEKGLKDVFIHALEAIQWMIRIGKHVGEVTRKRFENVQFRNENTEIGIYNSSGDLLFVPKQFFDFYISASPKLLKKMAELVESQRTLEIGVYKNDQLIRETVLLEQRGIFAPDEGDEEYLFPELVHGQQVVLEGHVTRGNESTNSVGFKHKGHILACYPESGSIVRVKPALFLNCRMHGIVSRLDKFGGYDEKRPKIIFSRIESLEADDENTSLF